MPHPPERNYPGEDFYHFASEVQVGASGLRAIVVNRKLRGASAAHNSVTWAAAVMEAEWAEDLAEGEFPAFKTDIYVDDAPGTPGNVRRIPHLGSPNFGGFVITLPREDGEEARRVELPNRKADSLIATYERLRRIGEM